MIKRARVWLAQPMTPRGLIVTAIYFVALGFLAGRATAAPLHATAERINPAALTVHVRAELKVKHSGRAIVWTQGCITYTPTWRNCGVQEYVRPVRLKKGLNHIRLRLPAFHYEPMPAHEYVAAYPADARPSAWPVVLWPLDSAVVGVRLAGRDLMMGEVRPHD